MQGLFAFHVFHQQCTTFKELSALHGSKCLISYHFIWLLTHYDHIGKKRSNVFKIKQHKKNKIKMEITDLTGVHTAVMQPIRAMLGWKWCECLNSCQIMPHLLSWLSGGSGLLLPISSAFPFSTFVHYGMKESTWFKLEVTSYNQLLNYKPLIVRFCHSATLFKCIKF